MAHRVTEHLVDDAFGSHEACGAVVTDQQGLLLECQVAVDDGEGELPLDLCWTRTHVATPHSRAFGRGRSPRYGNRRRGHARTACAYQPAVRETLGGIEGLKLLRLIAERRDEKLHSLWLRKEVDVRHVVARDVAPRPEAADPRAGHERPARRIDAPAAFRRHDEIVGGVEELIDAHV